MNDEAMSVGVELRSDRWVDVPAKLGDGSGCATGPMQLRRLGDGKLQIRYDTDEPGREFDPALMSEGIQIAQQRLL